MILIKPILIALILVLTSAPSAADRYEAYKGPFRAEVIKVTDADTIRVIAYPWPSINVVVAVRLRGIDTPEKRRYKCESERELAYQADEYVKGIIRPGQSVELRNVRFGKYAGRVIADLYIESPGGWGHVNKVLLAAGYAKPYQGGRKVGWC